ncbi:heparin lyase I family protein [Leptolyngbya sp. AN02str]|uniref:heparin lyase I family protein n=1 Tax=Leptolyngbya sp. AN02str TaxID=3423363 RepID=UPI003D321AB8
MVKSIFRSIPFYTGAALILACSGAVVFSFVSSSEASSRLSRDAGGKQNLGQYSKIPDPLPGVIRVQAEDMMMTGGYRAEQVDIASGGFVASLKGRRYGTIGRISYGFNLEPGQYDIVVAYYDETGDTSPVHMFKNAHEIYRFVMDKQLDQVATLKSFQTQVIRGVELNRRDRITVQGIAQGGEFGRIDYIEFHPVGTASSRNPIQPPAPSGHQHPRPNKPSTPNTNASPSPSPKPDEKPNKCLTERSSSTSGIANSGVVVNPPSNARLLFSSDFSRIGSPEWRKEFISNAQHLFRIENGAGRFELRSSDPNHRPLTRRVEFNRYDIDLTRGENWVQYRQFVPNDWHHAADKAIVMQVHGPRRGGWPGPVFKQVIQNGRYRWENLYFSGNSEMRKNFAGGNIVRGQWVTWTYHFHFNRNGDGFVRIWQNGKQVVNERGRFNDSGRTYAGLKVGLYNNGNWSGVGRRVIYYDDVQIHSGGGNPQLSDGKPSDCP